MHLLKSYYFTNRHFICCWQHNTYFIGNTDDMLAVQALQDTARLVTHTDDFNVFRSRLVQAHTNNFGDTSVHSAAKTWGENRLTGL